MADKNINIKISAKDKTKGALNSVSRGFKKLATAVAAFVSARAIIGFTTSTVKAFMQQEDAVNTLTAALSKNGEDVDSLVPKYQKFAAAVQTVTKHGDEGTLEIMAYGRNLGIATDQLEDATKAAIGLAAKFKLDLRTSMMLVGRASQGQTQMLTRYGIALDETLDDTGKFNALLKIGAGNFRLASDEAGTLSGRLTQAKNAFGDMKENIGQAITEGFNLTQMFDNMALNIQAASEAGDFKAMADDLKLLKDALKPVVGFFKDIVIGLKGMSAIAGQAIGEANNIADAFETDGFKGAARAVQDAGTRGLTTYAEDRAQKIIKRSRTVARLRNEREERIREFGGGDGGDATNKDIVDAVNGLKQKGN